MLILARKLEESLVIGDGIEVKIVAVQGSGEQATVRLGIVAPKDVRIWRKEVYDQVVAENRQALSVAGQMPAVEQTLAPGPVRLGGNTMGGNNGGLTGLALQPRKNPTKDANT